MRERLATRLAILVVLVLLPVLLLAAGRARDPFAVATAAAFRAPDASHPFGTDSLGRDLLARTLYATGLSLEVVLLSVAISFVLAMALGGLAGYHAGRWPDRVVSWVISLLFTVPFILIVVAIFTVVRPSIGRAYVAIGCIGWAAPARIVRAEVIRVRESQFVLAERAFGFGNARILAATILPLCTLPALVSLLYFVPELIGLEVGLSFFGLGAEPPIPTLGTLIYNGLGEFSTGWWLPLMPAAVLLAVTSALVGLGRFFVPRSGWAR